MNNNPSSVLKLKMEEKKTGNGVKRKALQNSTDDDDDEDGILRKQAYVEKAFLTDDVLIHVMQFVKRSPTTGLKNVLQLQLTSKRMRNLVELVHFYKLTLVQYKKDGLLMNGVALSVDDLEKRLDFFLTCFIRVSVLEIRFQSDVFACGSWWTKFGGCLHDSGKMEIRSLTVRSTWNDDHFYGPIELLTWITDLIKSNAPTLRRLNVPASLIPLDHDWRLSYLRLTFFYSQPKPVITYDGQTYCQPKQTVEFGEFMKRMRAVTRLCVDGWMGFSLDGDPLIVDSTIPIHPFYLSANSLKVRHLEVIWPDPLMVLVVPLTVHSFLTVERFLRQVQTFAPKGAPANNLSSVRVLSGRFALSKTFLEITSDQVKSLFFAIAMKTVMPELHRVEWTLIPHYSNPCRASFDSLVRCANHLFVMLADFNGHVTLLCDRREAMMAKDLLLYTMLNGPGFAGAKLDVYAEKYVLFVSRNRKLTVRISLQ